MPDDDRTLREAFDELRRADAKHTPPFGRVWRSASRKPRPRMIWGMAVALLLLIAGALLLARRPKELDYASIPPLDWKAPTDFLLDTPGSSLVRTVPRLPSPGPLDPWKGTAP